MDKATEIIKHADVEQLEFYINYAEMIIDELGKRDIRDENLENELEILTERFNELSEDE